MWLSSPWKMDSSITSSLSRDVAIANERCAGSGVLRSMTRWKPPPGIATPIVIGSTSMSTTLLTLSTAPEYSAAPSATASSAFTLACGDLPNSVLQLLAHQRHAALATHQDDVVDVAGLSFASSSTSRTTSSVRVTSALADPLQLLRASS